MKKYVVVLLFTFLFISCEKADLSRIPSYSANNKLQAMVSIPAGSATKYIYDNEVKAFKVYKVEGVNQKMNFLPAPFNIAFIPSTEDENNKPLDVVILSERADFSELIELNLIGAIVLKNSNSSKTFLLSETLDESKRIFNKEINELKNSEPKAFGIIVDWLKSYSEKDHDSFFVLNKQEAKELVQKSLMN